jgi:hypothetical protein
VCPDHILSLRLNVRAPEGAPPRQTRPVDHAGTARDDSSASRNADSAPGTAEDVHGAGRSAALSAGMVLSAGCRARPLIGREACDPNCQFVWNPIGWPDNRDVRATPGRIALDVEREPKATWARPSHGPTHRLGSGSRPLARA